MVEKTYTNQAVNAERFKSFCDQLTDFTQQLAAEKNAVEKAMKQVELQQQEGEAAFSERVSEDRSKFAIQQKQLEKELQKLTEYDDKLSAQKKEWTEKQDEAHEELMAQLDADEIISMETSCGDQFAALLDAMNKLSHQSMNDQFMVLKNNLDSLNIEKKQLTVSISDQSSAISEMWKSLIPTCGVTYKERNTMMIIIRNEVTKVRTEYQKTRLLEESLKAKLTN